MESNVKFRTGDTAYVIKTRINSISTGVPCSFCGGTGHPPWSKDAECAAKSYPYKCVKGMIRQEYTHAYVKEVVISVVRTDNIRSCDGDEETVISYFYGDMHTPSSAKLYSTYDDAQAYADKYNNKQISLFSGLGKEKSDNGND